MSKILLSRPTTDSTPYQRPVVYQPTGEPNEPGVCLYCREEVEPCGFDCAFSGHIHVSGPRSGSHKCGARYGDRDASP